MEKDNLIKDLEEIVDLGDPLQIQLYTDILSDQSTEGKVSKTTKLLYEIISKIKNGTTNLSLPGTKSPQNSKASSSTQSEEITRLLAHLQHFVSILESFSINSEYLNLFIENKETSSKLIPRTFFEAEAARLKSFLETFSDRKFIDSFLSKIQPEFLTQKLKELRIIQSKVENSTNVLELRNHFQEICTLFELSSLLNDRLIVKLRSIENGANIENKEEINQIDYLQKQIENLKSKLNEKEKEISMEMKKSSEKVKDDTSEKMQKIEIEVTKLRQLCKDYSTKSDELFEKNKKLKQDLAIEKQKQQQKKKEIQEIQKQFEKVKNSNNQKEEKYKKEIDALKSEKIKFEILKEDEIENLKKEISKLQSISSQFKSLKEKFNQNKEETNNNINKTAILEKENEKLKNEISKLQSISSQFQSLKEKYKQSKDEIDITNNKMTSLVKENEKLKKENKKMQSISSQFQILKEKYDQNIEKSGTDNNKISLFEKENEKLKNELNSISSQYKQFKEENENKISDLLNENEKLKSKITSNEISLKNLNEENQNLKIDVSNLNEKIEKQNSDTLSNSSSVILEESINKISSIKKKNKKLKILSKHAIAENDELRSKIDSLNFELNDLKSKLFVESNKSGDLTSQLNELKTKASQSIESLTTQLEKEKRDNQLNQVKIFEENKKLNTHNEFLIQNLAAFKEKFNVLKLETNKELKSLNSKVDVLQKQKRDLKIIIERLKKNAPSESQVNETISALEMEKNELKKENEMLSNQLNGLKKENNQLNQLSDEIATKYEQKIDSIKNMQMEIEKLSKIKDQIESQISSQQPPTASNTTNTIVNFDNSDLTSKLTYNRNFTTLDTLNSSQIFNANRPQTSLMTVQSDDVYRQSLQQNSQEVSKFAMMLAGALSEPIQMDKVKNEIFRLIDIVRCEHAQVSASQSVLQNSSSDANANQSGAVGNGSETADADTQLVQIRQSPVPILLPQFDDLDREIVNLQRCIKRK